MIQRSAAIIGRSVHLIDRVSEAVDVPRVLTKFGCDITTRVGLHDANGRVCGSGGLILPELVGGEQSCGKLVARLEAIAGVEVKRPVFGSVPLPRKHPAGVPLVLLRRWR